ncbi:hypothetical protein FACS1894132_00050 [Clostridia bacterium]|nr:hypothetical protein FACS1894132_00050 [Clostridia bacterium]
MKKYTGHIRPVSELHLKQGGIPNLKVISADDGIDFQTLSIAGGHLFFGDEEVAVKADVHGNGLYWKRNTLNGHTETGYLKMYDGMTYGIGYINRDGKKIRFETVGVNTYNISIQKDGTTHNVGNLTLGYKPDTSSTSGTLIAYSDWGVLDSKGKITIIASTTSDGTHPGGISLGDISVTLPVAFNSNFSLGTSEGGVYYGEPTFSILTNFKLTFYQPVSGVASVIAVFDSLYQNIDGLCFDVKTALSDLTADNKPNSCGKLTGVLQPEIQNKLSALLHKVSALNDAPNNILSDIEKTILSDEYPPSVAMLLSLERPSMQAVHDQSFSRMRTMAVYAASKADKDIFNYLNQKEPTVGDGTGYDLTNEQAQLATGKDMSDFLVNKFALGYLSYSYALSTDDTISKAIGKADNAQVKTKNFFSGTADTSVSRQTYYQNASDAVYNSVYIDNMGRDFGVYLADGKKWGTDLYNAVSTNNYVNALISRIVNNKGQEELNHLCTFMQILNNDNNVIVGDKTVSYAAAYHKLVVDRLLSTFVANTNPTDKDDADAVSDFNQFLIDFMETYFKNIQDNMSTFPADVKAEIQKDIDDAAKDAGYVSTEQYIANISKIASDAAAEILAMNDPDIGSRLVKFFQNHPKASSAISIAFYGFGVFAVMQGFSHWSKLNSQEKAEVIASTVAITVTAAKDITLWGITKGFKGGFADIIGADGALTETFSKLDFVEILSKDNAYTETLSRLGLDISADVTEAEDIAASAAKWQKLFSITTAVGKAASVLLMAAAVGLSIWQTYEDFKTGAGTVIETLDVISTVATGIAFAAEGIAICVSEVCAAIPVVGIVAAIVGIAISFAELFIKRDVPPPPIVTFISDKCVPFVNNLA